MKKIKITREQYNSIILAEQKRLSNNATDLLSESINENVVRLDEGWKDVVLGISMLMGVNLTGQNSAMAQKAINNVDVMNQIEATLEDEGKIKQLVDAMKEKGMKDPSAMLANNAEEIVNNFNDLSNKEKLGVKLSVVTVKNLKALEGKLKQGYAVKSTDIKQDTIKSDAKQKIVTIQDTVNFEFDNMNNLFGTGGYNLTEDGKQAIIDAIESVKSQNGKILSVEIESSTDAERVPSLITKDDPTGNIQLANLRSNSVNSIVSGLIDGASVTTREIPNNGSDIVSADMFKKVASNKDELSKLRKQTADFRYVKINIVAEFTQTSQEPEPQPDKIIKTMRFELVKMYEASKGTIKIGGGKPHFKHKKFKCKKLKDKSGVANCFTF
jgi:hypothetical protein